IDIQEGTLEIGSTFKTLVTDKVTATENCQFVLNMTNNGDESTGAGVSIINLGDAFRGNLVINSGVFALNNTMSAKGTNIGTAKLHLKGGTTFLIRNGISDGSNVFANDILLGSGNTYLRTYDSVNATISSKISGEGVVLEAWNMLHRTDGGTINLTGTINYQGIFQLEAGI
ncbi:MAG: hypothetical protein RSB24_09350, partial [Akkermansia sp.]